MEILDETFRIFSRRKILKKSSRTYKGHKKTYIHKLNTTGAKVKTLTIPRLFPLPKKKKKTFLMRWLMILAEKDGFITLKKKRKKSTN